MVIVICGALTFGAIGVGLWIDGRLERRGRVIRRGRVGFWGEQDR